jgi:hypothetical protein
VTSSSLFIFTFTLPDIITSLSLVAATCVRASLPRYNLCMTLAASSSSLLSAAGTTTGTAAAAFAAGFATSAVTAMLLKPLPGWAPSAFFERDQKDLVFVHRDKHVNFKPSKDDLRRSMC